MKQTVTRMEKKKGEYAIDNNTSELGAVLYIMRIVCKSGAGKKEKERKKSDRRHEGEKKTV